nr:26S rRNA (cytosine-C(5))-methyltransferase nsun-1-like [Cherax quadricarinatus]
MDTKKQKKISQKQPKKRTDELKQVPPSPPSVKEKNRVKASPLPSEKDELKQVPPSPPSVKEKNRVKASPLPSEKELRGMFEDFKRADELLKPFKTLFKSSQTEKQKVDVSTGKNKLTQEVIRRVKTKFSTSEEFAVKLLNVFGEKEALLTHEAIRFTPPGIFLRTNGLKASRKRLWSEMEAANVKAWLPEWSRININIVGDMQHIPPLVQQMISEGRCYLLGVISSVLGVVNAPKIGEDVLEMCATNCVKTVHIGAMMMNTGKLVARTLHCQDVTELQKTLKHLGVTNCVVTDMLTVDLAKTMAKSFDRVIIDAPCSGIGVVPPESGISMCKDSRDLEIICERQKRLIIAGAECLRHAHNRRSFLVYTTCSVLVEENEDVIQHLLDSRPEMEVIPTGVSLGVPGFSHFRGRRFSEDMCFTRRIYTHQNHMDGVFLAKLSFSHTDKEYFS